VLRVGSRLAIPLRELRFQFSRSQGPGGQNVQKTNTKATLRWSVARTRALPHSVRERLVSAQARRINALGELVLTSQRYRDQGRNVADCLEKLRALLEAASLAPTRRRATRPSRASVERRLGAKRARSEAKLRRAKPQAD
jgi:ribosome-associated protein